MLGKIVKVWNSNKIIWKLVSKGEKVFCSGVSGAHWKSFKSDLKGQRDKTRLTRDKPGSCTPVFEGHNMLPGPFLFVVKTGPHCPGICDEKRLILGKKQSFSNEVKTYR